ncbi:lipase family protein [Amycolatopsis sp. CA-230715]|uniref:lipase family protein n=1 Tax=Amycolatopsis sp. CA-230715 TaxID=2745196 RepID=UPI001C0385A7|nr:lipase family protein [Amycolatopsis sp. CA-230715]QWF77703.1 hypothetical protein HUW46_01095 [Amycolatopsis sp. CA-230715]
MKHFRAGPLLVALGLALAACGTNTPPDPGEAAKAEETANALPRDAFYDTPPDTAAAGTPLRAEPFTRWQLPAGASGTRLVYDSRSAQGKPVAASAAVLTPAGPPPPGGWPVVAWAHGTSGVAARCAPSLMKDLYYPDVIPEWLNRGYAVVAADYSGLGAGNGHEYLTLTANAADVRYAVAAARRAVPGLGERWVAVGHSQGGQTAWGVARQEAAAPTGGFLGAVALAPVTPYDQLQSTVADHKGQGQYLAYVASSIALQYPGFRPADMLTEAGMRDYDRYLHDGCWSYGRAIGGDGTPRRLLRPGWPERAAVKEFLARNRYTSEPLAGPLFVAAGTADEDVAAPTVEAVAAEQCGRHTPVSYHRYPGDHSGIVSESMADQARWVHDRFAGAPAPSTCGTP